MNLKRIFALVLALALVASFALIITSCGDDTPDQCTEHTDTNGDNKCDVCSFDMTKEGPSCTSHKDENADKKCDKCGEAFTPGCTSHSDTNNNLRCDLCGTFIEETAEITVAVRDQDGNAIPAVSLIFTDADYEEITVTVGNDGTAVITLALGDYEISYDYETVPEGYLPIPKTLTVTEESTSVELEVINNIPNGTEERPYNVNEDVPSITIPASTTYHYIIYHGANRTISFESDSIKVVYNEAEYTSESGAVSFRLVETDSNVPSCFTVENTSTAEITVPVTLVSDPGTSANPYVIESFADAFTANVAEDGSVYYTWTATASGILTLTSDTDGKHISVTAYSGEISSQQENLEGTATSVTLTVTEGDEVVIVVSTTNGNAAEIVFTITLE